MINLNLKIEPKKSVFESENLILYYILTLQLHQIQTYPRIQITWYIPINNFFFYIIIKQKDMLWTTLESIYFFLEINDFWQNRELELFNNEQLLAKPYSKPWIV